MPSFIKDTSVFSGGILDECVSCVKADNASSMTYSGTNTFIIGSDLSNEVYIVDPGPAGRGYPSDNSSDHLNDVAQFLEQHQQRPVAILLTHKHSDHIEGLKQFKDYFHIPAFGRYLNNLESGEFQVTKYSPCIKVIDLPGHSQDSVGFIVKETKALLSGDILFRHGPTVIYYPDGNLEQYFTTLDLIEEMTKKKKINILYPAHGWPISNPILSIEAAREHRYSRLKQIDDVLAKGCKPNVSDLLETVYNDIDKQLIPFAKRSIQAQFVYRGLDPHQ